MTTSTEKNVQLLRTAFRTLETGDLDAAVAMLADDFVAYLPGSNEPRRGPDIWRAGAQAMLTGFPDLTVEIQDIFGADDKVTVLLQFHGTHLGTFQDLEPTGRKVTYRSLELYRIENGKVAAEWVAPDVISLMQQLTDDGRSA
ncbi:ester cyclase [Kribbella sp. NPDC026611]|uniref:ester cyclase n=1 Tax=Kribbella sp. NPDC026611 TaxID=3154911 RepID=UPI0033C78F84